MRGLSSLGLHQQKGGWGEAPSFHATPAWWTPHSEWPMLRCNTLLSEVISEQGSHLSILPWVLSSTASRALKELTSGGLASTTWSGYDGWVAAALCQPVSFHRRQNLTALAARARGHMTVASWTERGNREPVWEACLWAAVSIGSRPLGAQGRLQLTCWDRNAMESIGEAPFLLLLQMLLKPSKYIWDCSRLWEKCRLESCPIFWTMFLSCWHILAKTRSAH